MYAQIEESKKYKSRAVANSVGKKYKQPTQSQAILAHSPNVVQRITRTELQAVIDREANPGLCIWDYGYNEKTNLIVYFAEVPRVGTVEVHVHLAYIKNGKITGSNIRLRGQDARASIQIDNSNIQHACTSYWFPDRDHLNIPQGTGPLN